MVLPRIRLRSLFALTAGGVVLIGPAAALAEPWVATVGARVRVRPPYEGADTYSVAPYPTLVIRRGDRPERFTPPDGGGVFGIIDTKHFVAGPALRFRYRRSDHGAFVGLNRIGIATEPGLFVDVWPARWLRGHVEVRRGFGGHHGWVSDAGVDLIYQGPVWSASIGPRVGFGSGDYMRTYFGVTPGEAALSPVIDQTYEPDGGLRYTGATIAASRKLSRRWRTTADFTYTRLADRPSRSPIVRALGSGGQVSFAIGASYVLGRIN